MSYPTSTLNKRKDESIPLQKNQTHAEIEQNYEDEYIEAQEKKCNRIWLYAALLFCLLVVIGVLAGVLVLYFRNDPWLLQESVTVKGILVHLDALQAVANATGNQRSVQRGYAESAAYFMAVLKNNSICEPRMEPFKTAIYTETSPPRLTLKQPFEIAYQLHVDFQGMRYGGSGFHSVDASVIPIANHGCSKDDFLNASGHIVLIENGGPCSLIDRSMLAETSGAAAVILYNSADNATLGTARVRGPGWFPGDPLMTIPVLAGSRLLGLSLIGYWQQANEVNSTLTVALELVSETLIEVVDSFNVLCETSEPVSDPSTVIMAGAHLDGVPEGPGINDNGSGASTLLEIALQLKSLKLAKRVNHLVFAWWGSEETGLIGSRNYVNQTKDLAKVALYLNFDMLASPNYVPGVFDGSTAPTPLHNATNYITSALVEYFTHYGLPFLLQPMVSGSDFVPFMEAGIPTGGLAAGAAELKTMEQRKKYGGIARAARDPCYHRDCDTTDNINQQCLSELSGAADRKSVV